MCGRVRFVARSPSRFCCHCHCESCRRSHGAGYVTWVGYKTPQVTHRRRRRSGRVRILARHATELLPRLRHQAFFRVGPLGRRDAHRARRVHHRGRPRARRPRVLRRARAVDAAAGKDRHASDASARNHRARAGRRPGPAHGHRRQGPGAARRPADGRARARALRAAGRRHPDQRQPASRPNTRRSAIRSFADAIGGFAGPLAGLHVGLTHATQAAGRDRALRFAVPAGATWWRASRPRCKRTTRSSPSRRRSTSRTRCSRWCAATCCRTSPRFLEGGGRKIDAWYATLDVVEVAFDDEADAFRNINTADELRQAAWLSTTTDIHRRPCAKPPAPTTTIRTRCRWPRRAS